MITSAFDTTTDFTPPILSGQSLLAARKGFTTHNYQEARQYVERSTRGFFDFSVDRANAFESYGTRAARLGNIIFSVVKVDSQVGYDISTNVDPDGILLHVLFSGDAELRQGPTRTTVSPSKMFLLETNAVSSKRWYGPTQILIMRLSRRSLEKVAVEELGYTSQTPLEFGNMQVLDLTSVPTLWAYILTICHDLGTETPAFEGAAGRLAERALSLLLLRTIPNSYEAAFAGTTDSGVAPYYVRRAESYIRQNARSEVSMDDIIRVSGVSARSIYSGFRTFRSTTPMRLLKDIRLDLARAALSRGHTDASVTVTTTALDVGYGNLSQFSRDYRDRFKESPSATLRRS